jgi:hypothetical protein
MAEKKVCPACGKEHQAADACPWCGAKVEKPAVPDIPATAPDTKENRVIRAKIATKQQQIKDISQIGPIILCIIGLPCLLLYIIPGLIVIGAAVWWSSSRENEKKKLQNEIKELEAELEP